MFGAVRYWFGKYGIYVNIEENKELIFAADVWYNKSTCLISAYFSIDGFKINVSLMSTKTCCLFL